MRHSFFQQMTSRGGSWILQMARKTVLRKRLIAPLMTLTLLATLSQAQTLPPLTHHLRDVVRNGDATTVGRLPGTQIINLDLVLPLSDPTGLESLLKAIYDPHSPSFHKYLTPSQFTERFGPSQANYDAVVNFAKSNGLQVTGGSRDGMEVQVKGTVSAIEGAFHIIMRTYRHPTENRTFYAPDREPTVDLPFALWHISGLDNYSIPKPRLVKKSDYARAHGMSPEAVPYATSGSGPSASFLGSDMRAAYYGNGSLTGAGQNLGLWEFVGTDLADLNTYYSNAHQTNTVPITLLSVDGTSTLCVSPSCDDTEQTLDMTQALGMAPGLTSLTVYIGSSDTAIISAMTTHSPLPATIGCSWVWSPTDPTVLDPYFEKMASQGQTFFAASGDHSTWSSSNLAWPADDPHIVSVGGTDLTTASAAGSWASETTWSDSGGGVSPDEIPIPWWQQLPGVINSSNDGSTTLRNGPDVSANANFTYYVCADQTTCTANEWGGTSFAAPLWAGYMALANQQAAASGESPVGFIDPAIYEQSTTAVYDTAFHDITNGTSGSYSAVVDYDLVTGWGSPKGANLINALTQPAITIGQLAGPWQITLVGNTGCGQSSMLFTGTLNASGTATGTLTGANACSPGPSSSTQTFTITSLNALGTGKAALSCGSGCGWNFDIQVAVNRQTFNLVDFSNGGSNVLAGTAVAAPESTPPISVQQLAGPWQITFVGNTGCGQSSMLFSGTLNASGTATGTLTGASGCSPNPSSSAQTFTITSLNANGAGTAALSCGSGCGWNFDIQVAADKQMFNLVDVTNGGTNVLAGTAVAVAESAPPIAVEQLAVPWQITLIGNTGCGRSSMLFTGTLNADTATGTLSGTGTLTVASGCSPSPSSSAQTFTITSLDANGTGTAALSCGSGCGWNFDIQVAAGKQIFNLVDVTNGGANVLAGAAVAEPAFVMVPKVVGDDVSQAEAAVQAVGLLLRANDRGTLVVTQTPAAGAWVAIGSAVNVELLNTSCGKNPCP